MCIFYTPHSSVSEHSGCFHILAVLNNATVNLVVRIILKWPFCFLQKITQKWVCTICFFESISVMVIITPFEDCLPGTVGPDYTMSPPLSPILLWFLLYILSFGRIFSVSLQIVFVHNCSVKSCNFGVPSAGCELRVFLLHHLSHYWSLLCYKNSSVIWFKWVSNGTCIQQNSI